MNSGPQSLPEPRTERRPLRSGYLPSLDGWRGLAILGVLMDHDQPWVLFGHSNADFHIYGGWGVFLFFAISGFLVCTRILEDESLRGRFHVGSFYVRRFFRIQPAALVYLLVIALLTVAGIAHERASVLLGSLFLYSNYLYNAADHTGTWAFTGQFWTLSVEEHFYLVLSALLFLFRRRRATVFAVVLVLLYVSQRLGIHFRMYPPDTSTRRTELVLPFLLFASLCAILLRRKPVMDFALRYLRPWVVFAGTVVANELGVLVTGADLPGHRLQALFLHEPRILFLCFTFWVIATVLHPRSWTTRFLELSPLRYLGRLSYSIYLWHEICFVAWSPEVRIHNHALLVLAARPWRYIATAAASLISFYCVEKPFIRLGHRLAPPASPGHTDLGSGAVTQVLPDQA